MRLLPPHHVFQAFLPDEDRTALLDFAVASEKAFVPTTVARNSTMVADPELRVSSKLPDLGPFKPRLREALRAASGDIFACTGVRPFEIGRIELELVAHNDGAHFVRHRDTLVGGSRAPAERGGHADRIVSGVYYFFAEPKAFSGGELRLHAFASAGSGEEWIDIEPAQNSLVVFPSLAPHEVLKVSCPSRRFADSRFAVNCWFYRAA